MEKQELLNKVAQNLEHLLMQMWNEENLEEARDDIEQQVIEMRENLGFVGVQTDRKTHDYYLTRKEELGI